ncbi:hypothetical protein BDB01DRAFT_849286 [Pilobolus umbonatus]|nr:hypothetical protein BDB01DRAFT_849286 [Pilobolus umbonatus]
MNRPSYNTENSQPKVNRVPYAQAARTTHMRPPHPPPQSDLETPSPLTKNSGSSVYTSYSANSSKNSYPFPPNNQNYVNGYYNPLTNTTRYNKYKDTNYNTVKKPPVQLPMQPPADTASIQFGSINQPLSSIPSSAGRTGDAPILRTSEVQFGSLPITDTNTHRSQFRPLTNQKPEIPRSPRTTNDGRLFTQPFQPRQNQNQGDNNNNNTRYYNNRNSYGKSHNQTPPQHQTPPLHPSYHPQSSPSHQPYPHQIQQQQGSSPMNIHRSPNLNNYHTKKNMSPHISHTSANNVPMPNSWPTNPYYYSQYTVPAYNTYSSNRTHIVPPPPGNRKIDIIHPDTGATVNSNPSLLAPSQASSTVRDERPDIKICPPNVKKAVKIIDPACQQREKREREEAEQEELRIAEEEKLRKEREEKDRLEREQKEREERERREQEERERKEREERERIEREEREYNARLERERIEREHREREERERLEREEQERLEREEKERLQREEEERLQREKKEREELEERMRKEQEARERQRIENEQREAEKRLRKEEEERRRKFEEEQELKRIKSELEAKKRKEEEDRAHTAEVTSQTIGRVPTASEMNFQRIRSESPVSTSLASINKTKQQIKLINDPSTIEYPPGTIAPSINKESGKFTYSVEFLMQFQNVCKDTDEDLSAVTETLESSGSRSGSGTYISRRGTSDRGKGIRSPTNAFNSNGPNDQGYKSMSRDNRSDNREGRMEMGKFNMGRPLTSRNNSNQHIQRADSNGARGNNMSKRSNMKIIRNPPQMQQPSQTLLTEPVTPLTKSENRWVPTILASSEPAVTEDKLMTQEYITRKVNALLNKLTLEKFDSIAAQIFEYAHQSAKEEDGRSLRTVMQLTFEKACDEPAFVIMWARLCRYMYDNMKDDIRDLSITDEKGNHVSGVPLFRKYLFNRCQVEFEKGWKVNMPEVDEVDGMMTEEYYIAAKAKRQGLGLLQFIGELFKLGMLSEKVMYGCVTRLCNDPINAGDEEAESLCKLLSTIGKVLDSKVKQHNWIDVIFNRMKNEMIKSPKLTSRVRFMIQDLLDLRKQNWVPRQTGNQIGPTTIAKIHEMAEKAKEEKEAANMKRGNSARGQYIPNHHNNNNSGNNMTRTGSYRGNREQNFYHNNNNNSNSNNNNGNNSNINTNMNPNNNNSGDGWSTVGSSIPQGGANKAFDLANFGKSARSRTKVNILGPSNSPFPSLTRGKMASNSDNKGSNDSIRLTPATNIALSNGREADKSDDRKKAQMAPKKFDTTPAKPTLSDDIVKRRSKNILEEYFSIRDKKELSECIKEFDNPHYLVLFVEEMMTVLEKKESEILQMIDVAQYLKSEQLLPKEAFMEGFKNFMEGYDDLTIDVPQAPKYVAKLLLAMSLSPSEVNGDEHPSLIRAFKDISQ